MRECWHCGELCYARDGELGPRACQAAGRGPGSKRGPELPAGVGPEGAWHVRVVGGAGGLVQWEASGAWAGVQVPVTGRDWA